MPISALSKIGLKVEATWGAGGSPTLNFPIEDWSLVGPYEQILDNAKRGVIARDFQAYQGVGRAEASLSGNIFTDLFGYLLKPTFGAMNSSGTAAPYTHTFTFSGSPPSLCMVEDDSIQQKEGKGLMVAELSVSMNPTEGALTYSMSMVGKNIGTVNDYTFPADLHEDDTFFLGWEGSVALNGTYFPVTDAELSISREVFLHYNLQNTQYAGTAYAGAPEITGGFTIDYDAAADWARYHDHQQGSINIYYVHGADNLTIELGSVDFGEGPIELDRSGASITAGYSWRALYQTALGGPARAILVCNTATF